MKELQSKVLDLQQTLDTTTDDAKKREKEILEETEEKISSMKRQIDVQAVDIKQRITTLKKEHEEEIRDINEKHNHELKVRLCEYSRIINIFISYTCQIIKKRLKFGDYLIIK